MRLTDYLSLDRIRSPLAATTHEGAIEELVGVLAAAGELDDAAKTLQAVLDREKTRTTGIGCGLAIPHGKSAACKELAMALGKSPAGIDFRSIDGKPVTIVILVVSPQDQTGPHIQALARISRLMSIDAFRNKLNAAQTPADILQVLQQQEKDLTGV